MTSTLLLSMPGGFEWIMPIVLIIVVVALRSVVMWYYGMTDLINESKKQTALLEEIRDNLKKENSTP